MLKVVKIGGNIVDNPVKLQAFLADFTAITEPKILVHGGGKVATAIAAALGIETMMIEGRRVTNERTLEVVTMVYSGINKQIVSLLQGFGCNAVGLCGADGRIVVSRRREMVSVDGRPVDYGFVGDPVSVNVPFIQLLTAQMITPVISPITMDGVGQGLLNTNADTVAQVLAVSLAGGAHMSSDESPSHKRAGTELKPGPAADGVELIYCFEKQGVMANIDDPDSVITHINRARFTELKAAGAVHSGMLPKLENAFCALDQGVASVVICAAENIAKPGYGGTTIVP